MLLPGRADVAAFAAGWIGQTPMRILVVEDDPGSRDHIMTGLSQAGHEAFGAADGETGLRLASGADVDVVVVDRLLPCLDGLSLVRRLRESNVTVPVLFLSALGSLADRVEGLDSGGDDYLVKPFSLVELNARVNALARRPGVRTPPASLLQVEDLTLDRLTRAVRRADRLIELMPMEYRLLEFLMLHQGRMVTRIMMLEQVWGFNFDPRTNIVETHISRLRSKIGGADAAPLITTVRGAGYVIGEVDQVVQ